VVYGRELEDPLSALMGSESKLP